MKVMKWEKLIPRSSFSRSLEAMLHAIFSLRSTSVADFSHYALDENLTDAEVPLGSSPRSKRFRELNEIRSALCFSSFNYSEKFGSENYWHFPTFTDRMGVEKVFFFRRQTATKNQFTEENISLSFHSGRELLKKTKHSTRQHCQQKFRLHGWHDI